MIDIGHGCAHNAFTVLVTLDFSVCLREIMFASLMIGQKVFLNFLLQYYYYSITISINVCVLFSLFLLDLRQPRLKFVKKKSQTLKLLLLVTYTGL